MAENSKIEWTDHTFNPWIGCQKVSAGCDHCYAESLSKRYGWVEWGPHGERKRTSAANWRKPIQWNKAAKSCSLSIASISERSGPIVRDALRGWARRVLDTVEENETNNEHVSDNGQFGVGA